MTPEEIRKKFGNDIADAVEQHVKDISSVADSAEIIATQADTVTRDLRREAEKRVVHALMGVLQLADSPAQRASICLGVTEQVLLAMIVTMAPYAGKQAKWMLEGSEDTPIFSYVLGAQIMEGLIEKELKKLGVTRDQMREMGPDKFTQLLKDKGVLKAHG